MRLPPRIKTRLDARLQTRLSSAIQAVSRYFKRNEGSTDYISHSAVTADRIVMDVVPLSNSVGLPAGAPAVIADKYQTIDFAYAGSIQYIGRNGADYFKGIIANVRYYLVGTLIHSWNIDSNSGAETDSVGGLVATLINWNAEDWKLFTRDVNDWVRDAVLYPNVVNHMASPYDPAGWFSTTHDSDTSNMNVVHPNPSGVGFVGRIEQVGTGGGAIANNYNNRQSFNSGDKLYTAFLYKPEDGSPKFDIVYSISATGGNVAYATFDTELLTKVGGSSDDHKFTDLGDGQFVLEILRVAPKDLELAYGSIGITLAGTNSAATIGSALYVQAVFFGSADDWPAITQERLSQL